MALKKSITQDNGITLNYHRIVDIRNVVNGKTILTIYSYVNETQRQKELNQPKYSPNHVEIYKITSTEELNYNDTLTIENAYNYLKTIDKYSNAEDI